MKKLLILLFSILISFNSYGKTVCVDTDTIEDDVIIYLPNENKPFTGKHLCKYENGQVREEATFKDGKLDGKWTWWYENGQIESEANFKDGKEHGIFTEWDKCCQIVFESYYIDGKKEFSRAIGIETFYSSSDGTHVVNSCEKRNVQMCYIDVMSWHLR